MAEKFMKKPVLRKLPCILTPEELQARGQSLASCRMEIDRLTAEAKSLAAEYKDQLKGLGQESKRLAKVVKDRQETREVRCEAVLDFKDGRFCVARLDTGEVLEGRPLTDGERQMALMPTLPDSEPAPASAPEGEMAVELVPTPGSLPADPPPVKKGKAGVKGKKGRG